MEWESDYLQITIRESTKEERWDKWPPIIKGNPRIEMPKYVVCRVDKPENIICVFGLPQGASTKAEAVFWAERAASKNGLTYIAPEGWENVKAKLKS